MPDAPDVLALSRLLQRPPLPDPWSPLRAGPALPLATLDAMRLEGLVVHVAGPVYLPVDAVGHIAARRAALQVLVPAGAVVGLLAAAWAHGVTTDPDPVDVLVRRAAGGPGRVVGGVRRREIAVPDDEVLDAGRVRLTTPARTAADVARHVPADLARPVLTALLATGADVDAVLAGLGGERRYPRAVAARALVEECSGQREAGVARRPVSR